MASIYNFKCLSVKNKLPPLSEEGKDGQPIEPRPGFVSKGLTENLEVVSKPQIRLNGKASGRLRKRSIRTVCEHLLEACDAPQYNRIDANPATLGNTAIGPLEHLKSSLN